MSTTTKTLLSLPTEILHRIFDDLDAKTISLSVRRTCKQLQLAANTYNRLKLNWMSPQKLTSACQIIAPENVLSLCVHSDKNSSTNDFASLIDYLPQFTSLRSLTVNTLNNVKLNNLLNYLPTSRLTELTMHSFTQQKNFNTESRLTTACSQAIMNQSTIAPYNVYH